jgi:hypothetical protein
MEGDPIDRFDIADFTLDHPAGMHRKMDFQIPDFDQVVMRLFL